MELNLRERTVVIMGPVRTTLQNLVMGLTAQGADVGIVDADADKLQRFCNIVNEQRESNEKMGRAAAFRVDWAQPQSIKDGIGQAAQAFGSIDVFIDAMVASKPTPLVIGQEEAQLENIVQENLVISLRATQFVTPFLKGRKRGRIIYLLQESMNRGHVADALATAARTGMIAFARTLSRQMQEFNVTVNCLSLGLTEEYLLGHFPDAPSIKEAHEKFKALDPQMRISDPDKITSAVLFLSGSMGQSVTGQHISLS